MPSFLEKLWYDRKFLPWLLLPLTLVYRVVTLIRRIYLQSFVQQEWPVPLIVVGNLSVGGVGKTPLVVALAKAFQQKGLRVGIVSRGYGGQGFSLPHEVTLESQAAIVGDEPLLIARKTGCPVVIAAKRVKAVRYLLDKFQSQVIISDDGLQHYAMGRAIEVVVIDGIRGFGNGWCLPSGPLREPPKRLKKADLWVVNGGEWQGAHNMTLKPGLLTQLISGHTIDASQLPTPVAAVAGIGHPQRFFQTLSQMGLTCMPYSFSDHHLFQPKDLQLMEKSVVMTEKDAVKCESFASESWYFLPVEARLSESFWQALWSHEQLKRLALT